MVEKGLDQSVEQQGYIKNAQALERQLEDKDIKRLIEATLFVAEKPMSIDELLNTVLFTQSIGRQYLKDLVQQIQLEYQHKGVQLVEVASGYRFQAAEEFGPFLSTLWRERAPRYSRALLETLALIAYRQPVTRGEIEDVRGVAVSSNIIKTLQEREWIKVVGHKEVPGRPALFATTKQFLDYFGLKSLNQLPALEEIQFTDELTDKLDLTEEQQQILAQSSNQEPEASMEEQHVEKTAEENLDE